MKKKSVQPAVKRSSAPKDFAEYFAGVPNAARAHLKKLRSAVRSALPAGAIETISYRIPAFKYDGGMIWYAAFSKHCSLFPGASMVESFKEELKGVATSKGTIKFPNDQPLPITLVKKLVRARVAQKRSTKRR